MTLNFNLFIFSNFRPPRLFGDHRDTNAGFAVVLAVILAVMLASSSTTLRKYQTKIVNEIALRNQMLRCRRPPREFPLLLQLH